MNLTFYNNFVGTSFICMLDDGEKRELTTHERELSALR